MSSIALYPGGFKPPHSGHFEVAQGLCKKADQLIIFIGPKSREGANITPAMSREIWEIYAKYLDKPVIVQTSPINPVRDVYSFIDSYQFDYDDFYIGSSAEPGDLSKWTHIDKNSNVHITQIPIVTIGNSKLSGSTIRNNKQILSSFMWMPVGLSLEDEKKITQIIKNI